VIKYLLALVAGMSFGMVVVATVVFYNPMVGTNNLSPLSVTENEVVHLSYSVAAQDTLVYTNDGESQITPNPPKVLQLWEPAILGTIATVNVLADSRGRLAGIGVKFSSHSKDSSVLNGKALVNSVWHIYLPERGSIFIEQSENYWNYIRDIVVPAYRSSGDNWRGTWLRNITDGPGALGTALVAGGSGQFAGIDTVAVEALSAKAYSVDLGPVAMTGELSIELPPVIASPIEDQQVSRDQ
jgi:hypothetical protein